MEKSGMKENLIPLTKSMFNSSKWNKIQADATAWWAGKLDRPLLQIRLRNAPTDRSPSKVPYHPFQSFYDFSVSTEDIVDAWDYELSTMRYMGDAFPHAWVNFGPGVIAAFMGAVLENGNETVWFHPSCKDAINDIRFEYDEDNIWFTRVKKIAAAAIERWQGHVQVGMTDLGGNLDILSSFRPNEGLLLDLYDHSQAVKKLTWQSHELWWRYYNEFNDILRPANPGYTAWCPIFSGTPYYMLQCDFSYMIGPDMFDEFVKPELIASCNRLSNAFYHLDGRGQLPHLDSLLSIPSLKGIQWVPGDGSPAQHCWPEIYKKIHDAGKLIQIYDYNNFDNFEAIAEQLGVATNLVLIAELDFSQKEKAEAFLDRWNS
jgi:5-methyltetrahydrofolate--homocysteine methyltransferase